MTALVVTGLLAPQQTSAWGALDWDLAIRQARAANLLARLAHVLDEHGLLQKVPAAPLRHLRAAHLVAERQAASVRWEAACIRDALADAGVDAVLLKGAAYSLRGLAAGRGRLFSDVDVMVPEAALPQSEQALRQHGWESEDLDAYDERYYRTWMHEIPPLHHGQRGTHLDLHHAILPKTARLRVDTAELFRCIEPVPGLPGIATLQPLDMLVHSATHLFHEGEFDNALRDLFDLDALLRDIGPHPAGWSALLQRGRRLGLSRCVFYALRYSSRLLGTPVPAPVLADSHADGPAGPVLALMDWCYARAFQPPHVSCETRSVMVARSLLYLRSHWLKMPLRLLLPHLLRKTWRQLFEKQTPALDQ